MVLHSLVIFSLTANNRCITIDLVFGGNFSRSICSSVKARLGAIIWPVIEDNITNVCFQKDVRDLQNQRVWAREPMLPHCLQQLGEVLGYIFESLYGVKYHR